MIRYYKCVVCGKEGISNGRERRFCSTKCSNQYFTEKRYQSCKYNEGVVCGEQDKCKNCGWNPKVAAQKKKALIGVMI